MVPGGKRTVKGPKRPLKNTEQCVWQQKPHLI